MALLSKEALLVRDTLCELGIETPMVTKSSLGVDKQINSISDAVRTIMEVLSLDLNDDSLCDTPNRVAKMLVHEIFSGLNYENFPQITTIENKMGTDTPVVVKDIILTSTCEHHLVVIDGTATVGYVPKEKVIGLSKINRLVRFFAQRPQVQERLTGQIFHALCVLLDTEDVFVEIHATHYCIKARGALDATSQTVTSRQGGVFKTRNLNATIN